MRIAASLVAAADHFDTYYGPLTHPIDFSQAQGLACGYPAAVPAVGPGAARPMRGQTRSSPRARTA